MKAIIIGLFFVLSSSVQAVDMDPATTQARYEQKVRNLIEPVLSRYCTDDCRLLNVKVDLESASADWVSPGFEEPTAPQDAVAAQAEVKMLIDDKIGKSRKARIESLLNQYFESLDFPVTLKMKSVAFPTERENSVKIADLRERIRKQFEGSITEVLAKYCPRHCLFSQFELETEVVHPDEAQSGNPGEYFEHGGFALRVDSISGTIAFDEQIPESDRRGLVDLITLRTQRFSNVEIKEKILPFPKLREADGSDVWQSPFAADGSGAARTNSRNEKLDSHQNEIRTKEAYENREQKSLSQNDEKVARDEKTSRDEKYSRFEKIERVESGDALHQEFQTLKWSGLALAIVILAALLWIALKPYRVHSKIESETKAAPIVIPPPPRFTQPEAAEGTVLIRAEKANLTNRIKIQRLRDELLAIFVENPKVARYVFSKVLLEEGIETTAAYLSIFGETIVLEILKDPSLSTDLSHLIEFYATTPITIEEDQELELLQALHARTISGKIKVLSHRTKTSFDFLNELDARQVFALVDQESAAVKAVVLTQLDARKREEFLSLVEPDARLKLMNELSRMDYLPKDYIKNIANALERKSKDNPKFNTESISSSEILVQLLESSDRDMQNEVFRSLEAEHPNQARRIQSQFVTLDSLRFLPDGKLVEVLLALKHDELLTLFKSMRGDLAEQLMNQLPSDLAGDLNEELASTTQPSREQSSVVERKVIHRVRNLGRDRQIDLEEINRQLMRATPLRRVV